MHLANFELVALHQLFVRQVLQYNQPLAANASTALFPQTKLSNVIERLGLGRQVVRLAPVAYALIRANVTQQPGFEENASARARLMPYQEFDQDSLRLVVEVLQLAPAAYARCTQSFTPTPLLYLFASGLSGRTN